MASLTKRVADDIEGFNYNEIENTDDREWLKHQTTRVLIAQENMLVQSRIIGTILEDVYTRLKNHATKWVEYEFGFSPDTASQYRNVAKRLGFIRTENAQLYNVSALYELAKPSNEQTLGEAIPYVENLVSEGVVPVVNKALAYVATHAPEYVKDMLKSGNLAVNDAETLTRVIERHPEIKDVAPMWGIRDAQVASALAILHKDGHDDENSSWSDIVHNGGKLVYDDETINLRDAHISNVQAYMNYRKNEKLEALKSRDDYKFIEGDVTLHDPTRALLDLLGIKENVSTIRISYTAKKA